MVDRSSPLHRDDARFVGVIAAIAAVQAAYAGCRPTGETLTSMLLTGAVAAFVVWAGATAPWVVLAVAGLATTIAAIDTTLTLVAVAVAATAGAVRFGRQRLALGTHRAAVTAGLCVVFLRLEPGPFHMASALVAAAIMAAIVGSGLWHRPPAIRRRVLSGAGVVAVAVTVAAAGFGVATLTARQPAESGEAALRRGLELVAIGALPAAAEQLREADRHLNSAADRFGRPWAQPARLVPVLAQHRTVLRSAAEVTADGAGSIATAAEHARGEDLAEMYTVESALIQLRFDLRTVRSPWVRSPVRARVDGVAAVVTDTEERFRAFVATLR